MDLRSFAGPFLRPAGNSVGTERHASRVTEALTLLKREFPTLRLSEAEWSAWAEDVLRPPTPQELEAGRQVLDQLEREGKLK